MALIYSLVSRGAAILADSGEINGNFAEIAAECLQKLPAAKKLTYKCGDDYLFNFLIEHDFTYCVVAESAGKKIAIGYLERIKAECGQKTVVVANNLNGGEKKKHGGGGGKKKDGGGENGGGENDGGEGENGGGGGKKENGGGGGKKENGGGGGKNKDGGGRGKKKDGGGGGKAGGAIKKSSSNLKRIMKYCLDHLKEIEVKITNEEVAEYVSEDINLLLERHVQVDVSKRLKPFILNDKLRAFRSLSSKESEVQKIIDKRNEKLQEIAAERFLLEEAHILGAGNTRELKTVAKLTGFAGKVYISQLVAKEDVDAFKASRPDIEVKREEKKSS